MLKRAGLHPPSGTLSGRVKIEKQAPEQRKSKSCCGVKLSYRSNLISGWNFMPQVDSQFSLSLRASDKGNKGATEVKSGLT